MAASKKIDFCYRLIKDEKNPVYQVPVLKVIEHAHIVPPSEAHDLLKLIKDGQLNKKDLQEKKLTLNIYMQNLYAALNKAGIPLPPEIPMSEFSAWLFANNDKAGAVKSTTATFLYTPSRFQKGMGILGNAVLWGAVASVTMMGTLALLSGSLLIFLSMAAVTAAVVYAERVTATSRWERFGAYLERIASMSYYDPMRVLKAKGLTRMFWGGVLAPYIYLYSLQRSLFLTAAAIRAFSAACGVALVGTTGSVIAFGLAGLSVLHMASLSVESIAKLWSVNKTVPLELPPLKTVVEHAVTPRSPLSCCGHQPHK